MTVASIKVSETPLVLYTLRRADDALILGHRLSEWCGHAPMLEEDMALANMGLDLLGQARAKEGFGSRVPGIAVDRGSPNSPHIHGTLVPVEEPSTASIPEVRRVTQ